MNLVILFENDFSGPENRVVLRGRRRDHIRRVHGACPGDKLTVGLLNGKMGKGTVVSVSDDAVEMEVALSDGPPPSLPVTVVLALPRPKVLRRALESLSSLGVKRICLINACRVEKSFWQSSLLEPGYLSDHLSLGLEQARDTVLPELIIRPLFRPFVEDELPGMAEDTERLVFQPSADSPCPLMIEGPATLVIGPEGGFVPFEIGMLASAGFRAVSLGPRVLRVETVLPFILSRVA